MAYKQSELLGDYHDSSIDQITVRINKVYQLSSLKFTQILTFSLVTYLIVELWTLSYFLTFYQPIY